MPLASNLDGLKQQTTWFEIMLCLTPTNASLLPPQVPEATVWYGPDSYMGANLAQLLEWLADMPDEEVGAICEGV